MLNVLVQILTFYPKGRQMTVRYCADSYMISDLIEMNICILTFEITVHNCDDARGDEKKDALKLVAFSDLFDF